MQTALINTNFNFYIHKRFLVLEKSWPILHLDVLNMNKIDLYINTIT